MVETIDGFDPGQWVILGGALVIAIVIAMVLIIKASDILSGWKTGLTIALVIGGLWLTRATINNWTEWRLLRDTGVESCGMVVEKIRTRHTGYDGTWYSHHLVVQFTNGQTQVRLKELVDESHYSSAIENSNVVVRFVPTKPQLAQLIWEDTECSRDETG